jgi:hypothetical protein
MRNEKPYEANEGKKIPNEQQGPDRRHGKSMLPLRCRRITDSTVKK